MAIERAPAAFDDVTWPFRDEEEMTDSNDQFDLILYLVAVLRWLYRAENWYVAGSLAVYPPGSRHYVGPDVSVFLGVVDNFTETVSSWRVAPPAFPPPTVVFEIASKETWALDIDADKKPALYASFGVVEYFAYDPNRPRVWRRSKIRLRGWRMHGGIAVPMRADPSGRLWSEQLGCWLMEDGRHLRLVDRDGNILLTANEAERAARIAAERTARLEAERTAAERTARIETERAARAEAERAIEAERAARMEAERRAAVRDAKLRELGFDPDSLP